MSGKKILNSDYEYEDVPMAHGSFSMIYKGTNIKTNQNVAIKKIIRVVHHKYLQNEIELMQNSEFPFILKLIEHLKIDDVNYLILEFCDLGTLADYIASKKKDMDYIYSIQIILGLQYLFHKNILHRDIKPQNILLKSNLSSSDVKICDFGFSKQLADDDLYSTFCGSPLYMAPEIFSHNPYSDKADIWSLGVILYELLTKEHPYPSKTRAELISKLKKEQPIDFSKISDIGIRDLLSNMLNYNVDTRFNWNQLFSHDWVLYFSRKMGYNLPTSTISITPHSTIHDNPVNDDLLLSDFSLGTPSIKPSSHTRSLSQTICTSKVYPTTYIKKDDFTVISKSAPSDLGDILLENYISNFKKEKNKHDIPIIGKSITPPNTPGILSLLSRKIWR